jgi:hypothetical protein
MGGRRPGLVDGDRCGGRWRPHPRSALEAGLRWQLVKRRGGSTTGRWPAALDGEEAVGSGDGGNGGAAGLAMAVMRLGAAVRVGNPNRPFLYRATPGWLDQTGGRTGCWARRQGRPVGPPAQHAAYQAPLARRARTGQMGQAAATACRQPRGPRRCQPPGPVHEAMILGPVALFLLFISFTNFQPFIFQSIDISLC